MCLFSRFLTLHIALHPQPNSCPFSAFHVVPPRLVSEPDPQRIGKEGLVNGVGWKCTLQNVRNFINCQTCKACRVFCWTRYPYKCSIFPAWRLQPSEKKQKAKMVLVRLAFPINAHQNANQKPIGSAPAHRAQCTLPSQPIYQTLLSIFRGSGSETTPRPCMIYTLTSGHYHYHAPLDTLSC